jgi:hypothetical protein
MDKRKKKLWVILTMVIVAVVGSGLSQVFLLNHKITTERRGLPAGTSLLAQGLSSNRMQYASLTTDAGETKPKGKYTKLSFDPLGNWTYIEGKTPIPDDVKKLNDEYVEMAGFMMPLTQTEKISQFMLIQALWGCCYGRAPAVNHVVMVKMTGDQAIKFYPEPIRVRGKFKVGETREDGYLVSLYRLEADEIQAK